MEGLNIVGVQFRRAGRIYDFAAGDVNLKVGDDVVVETDRGPSLAKVAVVRFEGGPEKDLKPIVRVATKRDLDDARKLTPEHAASFTREKADKLGLKMAVLQAEVQFGGNKVIIYFSAPGRVDFRELVKELASGLRARVELKQVGARDEAKLVGGIGICGREFCCSSFLREFVPVSIKMAKNQNLALNPSKVSGGCGRLLCCLTYENDLYTELRRKLPPRGTRVRALEDGVVGDVLKGDILNQLVLIETTEGRLLTVPLTQLEIMQPGEKGEDEGEADAWGEDIDIAALAELEDESGGEKAPRSPEAPGSGAKPFREGSRGNMEGRGGKPDARGGGRGDPRGRNVDRPRGEPGGKAVVPGPGGGPGGGGGQGGGGQQSKRGDRGPRGERGPKGDRGPRGDQQRGQGGGRPDRQDRPPRDNRGGQNTNHNQDDTRQQPTETPRETPRTDRGDGGGEGGDEGGGE